MKLKKKHVVLLSGEFIANEFYLYHNLKKDELFAAINSWIPRTTKLSAKSLAAYISSKPGLTALTKKQYKKWKKLNK